MSFYTGEYLGCAQSRQAQNGTHIFLCPPWISTDSSFINTETIKKYKPKDKEQLGSIQFSYVEAHFIYFGCFNHREKEISCETSIFLASYQYLKLAKQQPLSIYSGVLMYVMELPSATLPRSWASCDCATYIYLPLMITAGQQSLTLNQKALKPALHTVLTAQTKRQEQQEVCCNTGIFQARIEQSI